MNFGNGVAKILTKSMREETQVMYGRIWISVIPLPKFFLPEFDAQLPGEVPAWGVAKRKPIVATKFPKMGEGKKERNQLWQPICQNPKGVRREKIRIVAIKLPEMGGKKEKRKKKELWQKFNSDLGNGVAENWREKKL